MAMYNCLYCSLARVSPAPAQKLRLDWVYGYRGRDARANLHLLPTGEMAYFVAAVVVLYNAEDSTQRHYLGHTQVLVSTHIDAEHNIPVNCILNL